MVSPNHVTLFVVVLFALHVGIFAKLSSFDSSDSTVYLTKIDENTRFSPEQFKDVRLQMKARSAVSKQSMKRETVVDNAKTEIQGKVLCAPVSTEWVTTNEQTTLSVTTDEFTTAPQSTNEQTTEVQTTELQTTDQQTTALETTDQETTAIETTQQQTTDQQTTAPETTGQETTEQQTTDQETTEQQTTDIETTDQETTGVEETTGIEPDRKKRGFPRHNFVPCGGDIFIARGVQSSQRTIFYDAEENRYMVIFVKEWPGGDTSLNQIFLDSHGMTIASSEIEIEARSSVPKKSPSVTFNSVRHEYLIVYESGNPGQEDLVARRLNEANSTVIEGRIVIANTRGSQLALVAAYNPILDFYVVVFQDYDPLSLPVSVLAVQKLDSSANRMGPVERYTTYSNLRNPQIIWNSYFELFMLVYESDVGLQGTSDVVSHVMTSSGMLYIQGRRIAGQIGSNTRINDMHPRIVFAETTKQFIVVWQGDFDHGSDIFAQQLTYSNSLLLRTVVSDAPNVHLTHSRSPAVTWGERTNELVVVFDSDNDTASSSNIVGVVMEADNFEFTSNFTYVNGNDSAHFEIHPEVVYNTVSGQFFVIWDRLFLKEVNETTANVGKPRGLSQAALGVILLFAILVGITLVILVIAIYLQKRHRKIHGPSFNRFKGEVELDDK